MANVGYVRVSTAEQNTGRQFGEFEKAGIKANDYKKIKKMVDDNADIIIKRWKEYFDKDKREE